MEKNNNTEVGALDFFSSPQWPNELRLLVVELVTAQDLLVCRLMCKEWRDQLQKEIFWKIKIPPQLLNSLSGFNDNYYRFFTRGGVRLIQTLDHVKIFINRTQRRIESVPYFRNAEIDADLGFRYLKTKTTDFDDIDYARRYISAALKFDCPYFASPAQFFEENDDIYVVIDNQFQGFDEYLKTIQPSQYNEKLVTTLVRQLIQVTQYLHARGFNLLNSAGLTFCITKNHLNKIQLKVFNYGIDSTGPRYFKFVAPERIRPIINDVKDDYDFKTSDLFSLGSLTLYLLTGLPLYSIVHPMKAVVMLENFTSYEIPDPNNELSDLAKDFISRFLQRNPSDRMTLEDALNHPWLTNPDPSTNPLLSAYEDLTPAWSYSYGSAQDEW